MFPFIPIIHCRRASIYGTKKRPSVQDVDGHKDLRKCLWNWFKNDFNDKSVQNQLV